MSSLITSTANWLTNSHGLEMPGWMWILYTPIAALLFVFVGYLIMLALVSKAFQWWQ